MKILALVCSWAGERSHTAQLCKTLFDKLNKEYLHNSAELELITLDQVRLEFCRSCDTCAMEGFCPLAAKDDMGVLTQKMLDADLIFLGSPVYMVNVSGSCKNLIDRLELWFHTFGLAGKLCVPVVTSSNACAEQIVVLLTRYLLHMGGIVPAQLYGYRHTGKPLLDKAEEMEPMLQECCTKIVAALQDSSQFITDANEKMFAAIKKRYAGMIKMHKFLFVPLSGEGEVWFKRGYYQYATYAEMLANLPEHRVSDYVTAHS